MNRFSRVFLTTLMVLLIGIQQSESTDKNKKSSRKRDNYSQRYREMYEDYAKHYPGNYHRLSNINDSDDMYKRGEFWQHGLPHGQESNSNSNKGTKAQPTSRGGRGSRSGGGGSSIDVYSLIQPEYPMWIRRMLMANPEFNDRQIRNATHSSQETLPPAENPPLDNLSFENTTPPSLNRNDSQSTSTQPLINENEISSPPSIDSIIPNNLDESELTTKQKVVYRLIMEGDGLFKRRRYQAAMHEYQTAMIYYPKAKPLVMRLALSHFAAGNRIDAEQRLKDLTLSDKTIQNFRTLIASIYPSRRDFDYHISRLSQEIASQKKNENHSLYVMMQQIIKPSKLSTIDYE